MLDVHGNMLMVDLNVVSQETGTYRETFVRLFVRKPHLWSSCICFTISLFSHHFPFREFHFEGIFHMMPQPLPAFDQCSEDSSKGPLHTVLLC